MKYIKGQGSNHFQEMNSKHFFELLEDNLNHVNPTFKAIFKTFLKYKAYITNTMELPYSNVKLEATNNLIKVIKRNAFGFRKMKTIKRLYKTVVGKSTMETMEPF